MVGGSGEAFPAAGRAVNNSSGSRGTDSGHGGSECGLRGGRRTLRRREKEEDKGGRDLNRALQNDFLIRRAVTFRLLIHLFIHSEFFAKLPINELSHFMCLPKESLI